MSQIGTTQRGGIGLPPPQPQGGQPKAQRKTDIASRRNRLSARLWRFFRAFWLWPILLYIGYAAWRDPAVLNLVLTVLTYVLQIVFALFFAVMQFVAIFWFMSRSKVEVIKPEDPKAVTFNDYWGQPSLLRLVKQWISLLSDRDQFVKMGGKYINGILLYGPPGTGKTMLAKAMAGEAGIPFISIEGSGFRAMFIGVDVLKMIWFCGKAKKMAREYGACIAYIDEIDAVAMSRGGVMGGGGMMGMGGMMGGGTGALTRLLYEMDGIEDKSRTERLKGRLYKLFGKTPPPRNWHVLYMGSTNRPEVLDPALLRPGRFDQKIVVDTPDKSGRREIIKGYLGRVKYDETVNVEAVVEDTPHATPAQIAAAITKDAVRIALFNGRSRISQHDIDIALQEQRMGIEQPIEEWDEEQRRQVAYHEAGHAVAQHYLMPEQRIVRVSIIRRGGALGYMLPVDRVEQYAFPLRRFAADIMVGMAGHVATKLFMGEYWTGASGDFSMIRRNIWALYSLGYFGPPVRGVENSPGGGLPPGADPLIERFWKTLEDQTEELLRQHHEEVEAIAEALLLKSDLAHDEVMALMGDNGWRPNQPKLPRRELARLPRAPLPLPAPVAAARVAAFAQKANASEEPPVDPVEDTQPHRAVRLPPTNGNPTSDPAATEANSNGGKKPASEAKSEASPSGGANTAQADD
ncbi:MAG: AAA family ATPase [Anaerolineales bacterium]